MNQDTLDLWSRGAIGGKKQKPRLLFSSVFEDASVERAALRLAPSGANGRPRAFCIASGGDTALALLLDGASVRAIDINPAQIALCELKVAALSTLPSDEFQRALQTDARPLLPRLRSRLSSASQEFWDDNEPILARGLAFCGRAEGFFGVGAQLLEPYLGRRAMSDFFDAPTLAQARAVFHSRWQSARWRLLFRLALHPTLLRLVYARGFLHDLPTAFSFRIRRRIENALLKEVPARNPFASGLFRGRYSGHEEGWPLYARRENIPALRSNLANLSFETGDCAAILESCAPASLDFFALSNVLDAASPAFCQRLLRAVARAGAPGALVCLRAISSPPATALGATQHLFDLDSVLADELRARDISLFCPLAAVLRVR
jgi:S-adenosylmethionine-diacylglycerol 3-amino-3-carboxypropyl transferase